MFQALIEHIRYSFNGGTIRPAITIFRKREEGKSDMRIWNQLMVMMAGYGYDNGQITDDDATIDVQGDQINKGFTQVGGVTLNTLDMLAIHILILVLIDM